MDKLVTYTVVRIKQLKTNEKAAYNESILINFISCIRQI